MREWIEGSTHWLAQRHTPVIINDYTSTQRWVCLWCSNLERSPDEVRLSFPADGMNWPYGIAQQLIDDEQWDAILRGIAETKDNKRSLIMDKP